MRAGAHVRREDKAWLTCSCQAVFERSISDRGRRIGWRSCDEIWIHGAVETAGLIRQRAVSVVEVVESFLRRIEAVNPAINAVVALAPAAIDEARAADRSLARGVVAGPHSGVPFTAKDVFETARVETRVGLSERVGIVPSGDAVAVARMRQAGAIPLGKTNVPPQGSAAHRQPVHGRTGNPFDRERSWPEAAAVRRRSRRLGDRRRSRQRLRWQLPGARHHCGIVMSNRRPGASGTRRVRAHGGSSDSRTRSVLSRGSSRLAPTLWVIAGPDSRDSGLSRCRWATRAQSVPRATGRVLH